MTMTVNGAGGRHAEPPRIEDSELSRLKIAGPPHPGLSQLRAQDEKQRYETTVNGFAYTGKGSLINDMA